MVGTKRRPLLALISLAVPGLASGCLADGTDEYETKGNDDAPIEANAVELVLESHQIEGEGWEIDREHEYGDRHDRHFSNGEKTIVNVVETYDSVDKAKVALKREKEVQKEAEALHGTHGIGSDGFYYTVLGPTVVVRDANVIGSILILGGEDDDLVFGTAVTMHETWR